MDFAGVLTSNMVETIDMFEARERVLPGRFLQAWAGLRGRSCTVGSSLARLARRSGMRGSARCWALTRGT